MKHSTLIFTAGMIIGLVMPSFWIGILCVVICYIVMCLLIDDDSPGAD